MQIGKMMMILGAALLVAGALFYFGGRFHFLGHLPNITFAVIADRYTTHDETDILAGCSTLALEMLKGLLHSVDLAVGVSHSRVR